MFGAVVYSKVVHVANYMSPTQILLAELWTCHILYTILFYIIRRIKIIKCPKFKQFSHLRGGGFPQNFFEEIIVANGKT